MLHARTDLIFPFGRSAQFHEEKKGIPKRTIDRTGMKGCPTLFRNPNAAPSNVCSYRISYLLSDFYDGHLSKAKLSTVNIEDYHQLQKVDGGLRVLVGEKDRPIRASISIRPTVTIFANSPTLGCGGRSSGMKELHRREQGGNPFNLSARARFALHVFLSVFAKGIWARIVSFVSVVGEVTRKVAEDKPIPPVLTDPRDRIDLNEWETQVGIDHSVSQTASCEALALVLTINIGGFAWQRQV
ncbi:hypothetical protein ALC62_02089 [Cyphomyrmex costatus]|uniref:Uncharacterized protein n=1 Tax=Cyphomyrmex costatus TaxID=456900 RepID=A0A151IND3_9HYME|nr:hypothetical protein ALC62_02089 [Cyphomyrmex costatus]